MEELQGAKVKEQSILFRLEGGLSFMQIQGDV